MKPQDLSPTILEVSADFSDAGDVLMIGVCPVGIKSPLPYDPRSLPERYYAVLTTIRRAAHSEATRIDRHVVVNINSSDADFHYWAANFFVNTDKVTYQTGEAGECSAFEG